MHGIDLGADALQRTQGGRGQLERHLALGREPETGRSTLAQAHAQAFLHLAHMAADGGLGHQQHPLGGGKPPASATLQKTRSERRSRSSKSSLIMTLLSACTVAVKLQSLEK
jgi:hypothetical protein